MIFRNEEIIYSKIFKRHKFTKSLMSVDNNFGSNSIAFSYHETADSIKNYKIESSFHWFIINTSLRLRLVSYYYCTRRYHILSIFL